MDATSKRTLGAKSAAESRDEGHKYVDIPSTEHDEDISDHSDDPLEELEAHLQRAKASRKRKKNIIMGASILGVGLVAFWAISAAAQSTWGNDSSCDTITDGYQCQNNISHYWGPYSPYFTVPSNISADLPPTCEITFAQILSRHGARDPTASKTAKYNETVAQIRGNVGNEHYVGIYAFLADYEYTLGTELLTVFGEQQLVNSGIKFYNRYQALTKDHDLFVRSSGQDRVVQSARNWTQGFHAARVNDEAGLTDNYPYNILVISEDAGVNNTLSHSLCTDFEDDYYGNIKDDAQAKWEDIFVKNITNRLNDDLKGANLSTTQTIYMMDLCPFNTVASTTGAISPFCALFTEAEWHDYGYYQSLGKYYGYSWGNPLGPTQGVGFTNELVARLTNSSVKDHTSTNSTLDDSSVTFPLGGSTKLYADFSHDNDLTTIFSALGLYNSTAPLKNETLETVTQTNGYSASWTVPFAARAYFEKMTCAGESEELVRVIVNDRVIPLDTCGGDDLGRCTLSDFVGSLTFAQSGGDWAQCFA